MSLSDRNSCALVTGETDRFFICSCGRDSDFAGRKLVAIRLFCPWLLLYLVLFCCWKSRFSYPVWCCLLYTFCWFWKCLLPESYGWLLLFWPPLPSAASGRFSSCLAANISANVVCCRLSGGAVTGRLLLFVPRLNGFRGLVPSSEWRGRYWVSASNILDKLWVSSVRKRKWKTSANDFVKRDSESRIALDPN